MAQSNNLPSIKNFEVCCDQSPWWEPGKYDDDTKIMFLKPEPAIKWIKFNDLAQQIGPLRVYEMTKEIVPPKEELNPETKKVVSEQLQKWWEKVIVNTFYGSMSSLTVTSPGYGYKETPKMNDDDSNNSSQQNIPSSQTPILDWDGYYSGDDPKQMLKNILSSNKCAVKEYSVSTSSLDDSAHITAKISYLGSREEIWKERDEVCTERRIAELEKKNAELEKKLKEQQDNATNMIVQHISARRWLQKRKDALVKERDKKNKVIDASQKLIKELQKELDASMQLVKTLEIQAISRNDQLTAAMNRLWKAGLQKPGQNAWGQQVASPIVGYPGQHADWRKIVEVENESDQ